MMIFIFSSAQLEEELVRQRVARKWYLVVIGWIVVIIIIVIIVIVIVIIVIVIVIIGIVIISPSY